MKNSNTHIIDNTLNIISNNLINNNLMLIAAESCTGGLLAATCTSLAGSSRWFDRGYVTYSNQAKQEMLGVDEKLIEHYGAVSEEVAQAMAIGAYRAAGSENRIAVSVTGIAGPDGGSAEKPVGTVWMGYADQQGVSCQLLQLDGTRSEIREQTVIQALQLLVVRTTPSLSID